jgi:hypothetical protein
LEQRAPDGSEPVIRVVVTRAIGFSLALDSNVDDAEAAGRELLRACADFRAGQAPTPARMLYYNFEIVPSAEPPNMMVRVWETTDASPPEPSRQRGMASNVRLSLPTLKNWCAAWADGAKIGSVQVMRAGGDEIEQG